MTQEALKLALDAFEQIFESTPPYRDDGTCVINDKSVELSNKAIAAIKEALAQPEQEPVADSAFLERVLAAIEGVIDVADRKTNEFDALRGCIVDLTLMLHLPRPAPVQQEPEQPPQRKLLTDEKICLIAHNTDPNDWDDLTFKKCWHEGFKAGFREAEIEHNIKG